MLLRRAGLRASAGLSCYYTLLDLCDKFSFVYGNNQCMLLYKEPCFAIHLNLS